jgi:hypothetical protein
MKSHFVHFAAALALAAAAASGPALAQESGKVAVIHIKAIDGIDARTDEVQVTRDDRFTAGSRYRVKSSDVSSLGGIRTLVLIERRVDSRSGSELTQRYTEEVMAVGGDQFTVRGLDGKDLTYTVDVLSDGSVDLIGPGDRIVVRDRGEYHIWKVEKTDLVSADRILID